MRLCHWISLPSPDRTNRWSTTPIVIVPKLFLEAQLQPSHRNGVIGACLLRAEAAPAALHSIVLQEPPAQMLFSQK